MHSAITALNGEYLDLRTFRYARNQRDAGIEHMEWEERMKPLRPLAYDVAIGAGALAAALTAFLVFA